MSFPQVNFLEVVKDATSGNVKTKTRDYLKAGKYAIVDQGQELVGGYSDDNSSLCKATLPVIIFGDHTKHLKFIDFPFCLGADGTKVLRPKTNNIDEKYLYYFLQSIELEDAGYSRHYKFLKEIKIPLPPLTEQKRIAAILDQADALRRQRQRALDHLNQLGQSIFYEMFGDPVENPKNFERKQLNEIINFIGGSQPAKTHFKYEDGPDLVRFVQTRDFRTDKYKTYVPSELAKRPFNQDDVIIGRYGPPVFQIFRGLSGTYNVALMKAEPKEGIIKEFVFYLLQEKKLHTYVVRNSERTAGQSGVNLDLLKMFQAYKPPLSLQMNFLKRMEELKGIIANTEKSLNEAKSLFASLQQRAFRGEL